MMSKKLKSSSLILSNNMMIVRGYATKVVSKLSPLPICVKVTPHEVRIKSLTWQNLELATRALHRDGLVVLENVIEHSKLDFLNKKMLEDARTLQERKEKSPYNYNKGYFVYSPYLDDMC